ncbi:MAG TPA: serine--tRNA ligase [Candidatus Methylomirabilis sp.]|nr:serine--tRNA ligase [Candidatus Methylomirabilis sp.]
MLDLRQIREQTEEVERRLALRGEAISLRPILEADVSRRRLVTAVEELKAERNRASEAIGRARRQGQAAEGEVSRVRELGDRIKALDVEVRDADAALESLLLELPNLPHPSVPVGRTAEDNVEIRRWGDLRRFAFEPRQHFDVGEGLGMMDFERASKIAKSRFVVLWGAGARLSRALAQFMLDLHEAEHGFTELWVPHLVNAETVSGVGVLRKFEDQLFKTQVQEDERPLYLIPTAEVSLTALHRGETLAEADLPKRYCAFTPCYRREAGAAGQDTRGMIRQHQFDKVEMVKVTTPEQSYLELESMVASAEAVLRRLELPYRVMALCTGDIGFQSAKTYDIEVWLPGQGKYREISSCSNCEAFQARRLEIKYRPKAGGRADFCHTLNGSGLAVGRTLVAVIENYQEADGSVTIPEALRPYMGGLTKIGPIG